jgi:hypothetical protein
VRYPGEKYPGDKYRGERFPGEKYPVEKYPGKYGENTHNTKAPLAKNPSLPHTSRTGLFPHPNR